MEQIWLIHIWPDKLVEVVGMWEMAQLIQISETQSKYVAGLGDGFARPEYLIERSIRTSAVPDGRVYELGIDDIPDGIVDIRGAIHGEPPRVFAVVSPDECITYLGII